MDVQQTIEFLLEHQAALEVLMEELAGRSAEMDERHDRLSLELRNDFRRAVRMSIEEQRRERARRADLDGKITQLAAAQVVTEEKLQALIDALRNGK